jgi:hypothetical protein
MTTTAAFSWKGIRTAATALKKREADEGQEQPNDKRPNKQN